jgi:HEAT repeat protein
VAAAETLATLGGLAPLDARVTDALFHCITHSSDDPQFAAREALVSLAPWLPREELITHLGDEHWYARHSSLEALSALGPGAPSDVLVAAVGDMSEHIRETALDALRRAHPQALHPLLEEALAILQGKAPGDALGSLVRFTHAETIARREIRSPEAIAYLTQLLQWPYWLVRLAAVDALTSIGEPWPPATHERLERLIHDPQSAALRSAAQAALATGA